MGPIGNANDSEKIKIPCPCRDSNPGSSIPQPSHYTFWSILTFGAKLPKNQAIYVLYLKIQKVKYTLVQEFRLCTGRTAYRGVEVQLYSFMTMALEGGEGSASHSGRSLSPGKTWYLLHRRLGGPQGRSGQVRKISPPTGIRSPARPSRSQSLYRLSYMAQFYIYLSVYSLASPLTTLSVHRYMQRQLFCLQDEH